MTRDDELIPDDDAIARAARGALHRLADQSDASVAPWAVVQSGARRHRQRRVAAAGAALAFVLVAAGTAAAVVGSNGSGRSERFAGDGSTTTTTAETTTSASVPSSTTSLPRPPPGGSQPPATLPTPTVPIAGANDLQGTLTAADTMVFAEQPATVTLTVQNITDHAVVLDATDASGISRQLGVTMTNHEDAGYRADGQTSGTLVVLAAGEQRTFTTEITPVAELVGLATISAAFFDFFPAHHDYVDQYEPLPAVPSLDVTVVPPDWVDGQLPLDPALGKWSATMSADATSVVADDPVIVHAAIRNTGDQPQSTEGYGSLAIVCHAPASRGGYYWYEGKFIDTATIDPGATQTFSIEFRPPGVATTGVDCELGLAFHNNADLAGPRTGIDSDSVSFAVVFEPASSTTASEPPTSTAP